MNDIDDDHNKILQVVAIKYFFQNVRLILLVFILTTMLGLVTFFMYQITNEIAHGLGDEEYSYEPHDPETFAEAFYLYGKKRSENVVIMIYFAFTSLSTVGFGDYYPVGDFERLFTSLILLSGVATFSCVMDNFMQIVHSMEDFNRELEDSEGLQKFYSLLKKLNYGQEVDPDFI